MAFNIKYLGRVTSSVNENALESWSYNGSSTGSSDTLATIKGSGYFDGYADAFKINDLIYVAGTDDNAFLEITAVSPNVTVVEYTPSAGSVTDLDGSSVANVGTGDVVGGIPVLFKIQTAGGAGGNTDVTVTNKIQVIDVWTHNSTVGTAGDTVQVFNGGSAVSEAMDVNKAINIITRTGSISTTTSTIAAGGTLRVTEVDGTGTDSPVAIVYILANRVA